MSFSNLLPRSPWTPPHQPASRDNQPASPYSKRQATYPSQPVTQPVAAEAGGSAPEQGQGTMTLVQRAQQPSVYSLLPLPRYEAAFGSAPEGSEEGPPAASGGCASSPAGGSVARVWLCLPGDYVGSSFASAAGAVGVQWIVSTVCCPSSRRTRVRCAKRCC